jgi:hypothetical protein
MQTFFISGDYRTVTFSLLVPIGYVLVALGIMKWLGWFRPHVLLPVAAGVAVYCSVVHFWTRTGYYFSFVSLGLVGAAFGCVPPEVLVRLCRGRALVTAAYIASLAAISVFPQVFPLYGVSITITLLFLYMLGLNLPGANPLTSQLVTWGRYTLLLYLLQIAFLFGMHLVLDHLGVVLRGGVLIACVLTCAIQTIVCLATDKIRGASKAANTAYKWVFA